MYEFEATTKKEQQSLNFVETETKTLEQTTHSEIRMQLDGPRLLIHRCIGRKYIHYYAEQSFCHVLSA